MNKKSIFLSCLLAGLAGPLPLDVQAAKRDCKMSSGSWDLGRIKTRRTIVVPRGSVSCRHTFSNHFGGPGQSRIDVRIDYGKMRPLAIDRLATRYLTHVAFRRGRVSRAVMCRKVLALRGPIKAQIEIERYQKNWSKGPNTDVELLEIMVVTFPGRLEFRGKGILLLPGKRCQG